MIISGSVITFDNGVQQRPAIWIQQNHRKPWALLQLPEAGTHGEALSSICSESSEQCCVSGYADGVVALWSFDPTATPATGTRDSTLARMPHDAEDAGPITVTSADRPALLVSHAGTSQLLVSDSQGWRTFTGPAGPVTDAATVDDRLYAITRAADGVGLWTTNMP